MKSMPAACKHYALRAAAALNPRELFRLSTKLRTREIQTPRCKPYQRGKGKGALRYSSIDFLYRAADAANNRTGNGRKRNTTQDTPKLHPGHSIGVDRMRNCAETACDTCGVSEPFEPNPKFMRMAIALATENVQSGKGGPFGAVVVRHGEVIAATANTVTSTNDPTAHAEVNAIRAACAALQRFQLDGCDVYTSCEPCPMCLAALYWSRCRAIFYGNTAQDAAAAGFDDRFLYDEVRRPMGERQIPIVRVLGDEAIASFEEWKKSTERIDY